MEVFSNKKLERFVTCIFISNKILERLSNKIFATCIFISNQITIMTKLDLWLNVPTKAVNIFAKSQQTMNLENSF